MAWSWLRHGLDVGAALLLPRVARLLEEARRFSDVLGNPATVEVTDPEVAAPHRIAELARARENARSDGVVGANGLALAEVVGAEVAARGGPARLACFL